MNLCNRDFVKLDYINGLLSRRSKRRFERHLTGCSVCRREVKDLISLVSQLSRLQKPETVSCPAIHSFPIPAATPLQAVPTMQAASLRGKSRRLYVFSIAIVLSTTALLFFLFRIEAVQTWISSWLTPSLFKIQRFFGIVANGKAKVFQLLLLIISLCSLMLIPSIVENIYLLMRRKWNGSHYRKIDEEL